MSFLLLCAGRHRDMDAAGICWWASIRVPALGLSRVPAVVASLYVMYLILADLCQSEWIGSWRKQFSLSSILTGLAELVQTGAIWSRPSLTSASIPRATSRTSTWCSKLAAVCLHVCTCHSTVLTLLSGTQTIGQQTHICNAIAMAKAPCMTAMCKTHFTAHCCDQASVYRTLLDVVSGMQYLHGLGLVHGVLPPHPPSSARTFVSCVPACIMLQIYLLLQRCRSRLRPIPCWSNTIIVVMINSHHNQASCASYVWNR